MGWQFASHMRTDARARRATDGALNPGARRRRSASSITATGAAQYVSGDYTQTLADHDVLASVGSTGDAYDNSMAESFVDSFKTELIADRVWRTRSQLELAIVEYISWFNKRPACTKTSTTGHHERSKNSTLRKAQP